MKKRVILWGAGAVFANNMEIFRSQEFCELYTICAIVSVKHSMELALSLAPIPLIYKEDVENFQYEKIIIVTSPTKYNEILNEARLINVPSQKIISFEKFIEKESNIRNYILEKRSKIQLSVIESILRASDEEVRNYDWMYKQISRYGVFCFPYSNWYKNQDIDYTGYGILQFPREFAAFCVMLTGLNKIESAMELGVYRGRSSYIMAALLQRNNPNLVYNMVDIYDNLDYFDEFHKLLPSLHKCIPATSKEFCNEHYDFVFIDADHSYDASIADFYNVGQYANIMVGVHDIYAHDCDELNGGTVRTWNEVMSLTSGFMHYIFSEQPNCFLGIGAIRMK